MSSLSKSAKSLHLKTTNVKKINVLLIFWIYLMNVRRRCDKKIHRLRKQRDVSVYCRENTLKY